MLKKSKRGTRRKPERWYDSAAAKSTPASVREQEEDAAALVRSRGGARRRSGSGAHPNAKGDAVSFMDLGECKQRSSKSIRVEQKWLAKIEREARGEGKMPFLHLRFMHENTFKGMTLDWVIMPARAFQALLEAADE